MQALRQERRARTKREAYAYIHSICLRSTYVVLVSVNKNTPPQRKSLRTISLKNIKSGAGEQFLPKDCRSKACLKGLFFSQTPVCLCKARSLLVLLSCVVVDCFETDDQSPFFIRTSRAPLLGAPSLCVYMSLFSLIDICLLFFFLSLSLPCLAKNGDADPEQVLATEMGVSTLFV